MKIHPEVPSSIRELAAVLSQLKGRPSFLLCAIFSRGRRAPPSIPGTILQDPGGRAANPETYDSRTMTFWKMGELYIEAA
jgi:hypothetical protein